MNPICDMIMNGLVWVQRFEDLGIKRVNGFRITHETYMKMVCEIIHVQLRNGTVRTRADQIWRQDLKLTTLAADGYILNT